MLSPNFGDQITVVEGDFHKAVLLSPIPDQLNQDLQDKLWADFNALSRMNAKTHNMIGFQKKALCISSNTPGLKAAPQISKPHISLPMSWKDTVL